MKQYKSLRAIPVHIVADLVTKYEGDLARISAKKSLIICIFVDFFLNKLEV